MYRNWVFLFLLALSGCVSMPSIEAMLDKMYNVPSEGASQFDGTKHIQMSNMLCSNTVILEMYQDTKKAGSGVVLVKAGTNEITNIGKGESLLIKVDDKVRSFSAVSSTTEYEKIYYEHGVSIPFSNKSYVFPEAFVKEMASSNLLMVKMNLLNNTYIEGKCSPVTLEEYQELNSHLGIKFTQENINTANKVAAQHGIKEFVEMMESRQW